MLFIVATPIGNKQDISYRAAHTLMGADLILAEDTRSAHRLLQSINTLFFSNQKTEFPKIISYYKEKELEKLESILADLRNNVNVCLISESGMPVISDPGSLLVQAVIREGIDFTVIPGPSAVTTALIHAGGTIKEWVFIGFLPKKTSQIAKVLKEVIAFKTSFPKLGIVAFESPHRIHSTVKTLKEVLPDAHISISRELTKEYEQVIRAQAKDIDSTKEYKGEITLVIS